MISAPAIVRTARQEIEAEVANIFLDIGRQEKRNLSQFLHAGRQLIKLKDMTDRGDWLPTLQRMGVSARMAQYAMRAAKCETFRISKCESIRDVLAVLEEDEPEPKAHVSHATGQHEWYTPPEYIDVVKAVLGGIDLDPASSAEAQKFVKAKRYFTVEDDGLSKPWKGRIWLNPPYGSGVIDKFTDKLVVHYEAKDVSSAILLTNNATETEWYARAAKAASAVCFPFGRISYLDASGQPENTPLQGQSLLYLGDDSAKFCETFKNIGRCWKD